MDGDQRCAIRRRFGFAKYLRLRAHGACNHDDGDVFTLLDQRITYFILNSRSNDDDDDDDSDGTDVVKTPQHATCNQLRLNVLYM